MRIPLGLPPGLVSDDTSFSTPGRYEDGSNVRFWRGQPQTIGGWSALSADTLTGVCRNVHPWTDNNAVLNIAFGTHSRLQVYAGGALFDITPPGLTAGNVDGVGGPGYGADTYDTGTYGTTRPNYFAATWAFSTYGQSLIANRRLGKIYQWNNDTSVPAAAVANAPTTVAYALVASTRQLMAFGCNEEGSGTYNPLCIRFSDIENINVWTATTANLAGEVILEGGGRIVAAREFANGIAVWTDTALYMGTFTGDAANPWRFDRVEQNCGLIGPNAVAIVNQVAYWPAPDKQFRMWALGAPPQIIPCPIRSDFADNLAEAQGDKIVAASISKFGEVWWHYPDSRDGLENSRYVAMSTIPANNEYPWFRGKMARSAACDAGVAGYPIKVTPGGSIYYHELGNSANGSALEWYLTSSAQYLDEGGRSLMIRGISPDFEDQQGAISLTVYTRQYPQGPVTAKGPYTLGEGGAKKDFRATGRVFSLRFSGASNPSYMRLGKPVFDAAVAGER